MEPKTIVINKDGVKGVVIKDSFNSCSSEEVIVIFEGEKYPEQMFTRDLEIIGIENAVADKKKCGAYKGSDCCIFLTPNGCQRTGDLRNTQISQKDTMKAQREPLELYPNCQIF